MRLYSNVKAQAKGVSVIPFATWHITASRLSVTPFLSETKMDPHVETLRLIASDYWLASSGVARQAPWQVVLYEAAHLYRLQLLSSELCFLVYAILHIP